MAGAPGTIEEAVGGEEVVGRHKALVEMLDQSDQTDREIPLNPVGNLKSEI
jgi:hypothetical protein